MTLRTSLLALWLLPASLLAADVTPAPTPAPAVPWEKLPSLEMVKDRDMAAAIESAIRRTAPADMPKLEERFLAVALDAKATRDARVFACRMLRYTGGAKTIDGLAPLLVDPDLSHAVRFAIQEMPSPRVDDQLLKALSASTGRVRIGIVGSIGARRIAAATNPLKTLAAGNELVARAAIVALGHIGTTNAASALLELKSDPQLAALRADAMLACAGHLLADGKNTEALTLLAALSDKGIPAVARCASYRLRIEAGEDLAKSLPALLAAATDAERRAIVSAIAGVRDTQKFVAALQAFNSWPADAQASMLASIGGRGDTALVPTVLPMLSSKDQDVRTAAILALGGIGGPEDVPVLVDMASCGSDDSKTAFASLARLRGATIDATLADQLSCKYAVIRMTTLSALGLRRSSSQGDAVLKATQDNNVQVVAEAWKTLRATATPALAGTLIGKLLEATTADGRAEILPAVQTALSQAQPGGPEEALLAAAITNNPAKGHILFPLAPRIGGAGLARFVAADLGSDHAEARRAAILALSDWKDGSTADELLRAAGREKDKTLRALALRGTLDGMARRPQQDNNAALAMYTRVAELADTKEIKLSLLAALGKVADGRAVTLAASFAKDPALKDSAVTAALTAAESLKAPQPAGVADALAALAKSTKDKAAAAKLGTLAKKLAPQNSGKK